MKEISIDPTKVKYKSFREWLANLEPSEDDAEIKIFKWVWMPSPPILDKIERPKTTKANE